MEKSEIVDTLLLFYRGHKLTDYLKTLTDEELVEAKDNISVDRIDEEKGAILNTIKQELEYRRQDNSSVSHKR